MRRTRRGGKPATGLYMYKMSTGGAGGLAVSPPTAAAKLARLLAPPDGVNRGIDIFVNGPVPVVVVGWSPNREGGGGGSTQRMPKCGLPHLRYY